MQTEKVVNFLFELASLRRLTRSHRQLISEVSDNIADHSFRTAIIGFMLAKEENADSEKVMKMCLFHDVAEARTGDANFLNKQYVDLDENSARKDQLEGTPISDEIIALLEEYELRETKESIIAKDADLIDQMILQQEYFYKDEANGRIWHNNSQKGLKTETAKRLAQRIRETNPFEWLYTALDNKLGRKLER